MADEIYGDLSSTKHNLTGIEDAKDIIHFPLEKLRLRIKNIPITLIDTVDPSGIHFDRSNVLGVFDNSALYFDGQPVSSVDSIICPNNEFLEKFQTDVDIDYDNSDITYNSSVPSVTIGAVGSWGVTIPFTVPGTLSIQASSLVSEIFQFIPGKMLKNVSISVNDNDTDLDIIKYIDYGKGWTVVGDTQLSIPDNSTTPYYDNTLRYKILNDGVSSVEITKVFIKFGYY